MQQSIFLKIQQVFSQTKAIFEEIVFVGLILVWTLRISFDVLRLNPLDYLILQSPFKVPIFFPLQIWILFEK